jgi:predicted SprT family Zn-dependent metalloprotease
VPVGKKFVAKKQAPKNIVPITSVEYPGLQKAFEFFNRVLFDSELPNVVITLQRQAHSRGHFSANRFAHRGKSGHQYHELNLNPDAFYGRTDEQICSTLLHEMCHIWQQQCGKPPSKGYHNKEWASKMKSVGLYPSNTEAVGGKETGSRVSHYIIPNGAFASAYRELQKTGWKLNLQSAFRPGRQKTTPNSKTKYTCEECGLNMWGKPAARISCDDCGMHMTEEVPTAAAAELMAA